jgi:seryl-tRNA synthetase
MHSSLNYQLGLEIGALKESLRRSEARLDRVETTIQTLTWQISSMRRPTTTGTASETVEKKRAWWQRAGKRFGPDALSWIGGKLMEWGGRYVLPFLGGWFFGLPKLLQNAWQYVGAFLGF